jgi:hypothetical protein
LNIVSTLLTELRLITIVFALSIATDDLDTTDRIEATPSLQGTIWALRFKKMTKNTDFS